MALPTLSAFAFLRFSWNPRARRWLVILTVLALVGVAGRAEEGKPTSGKDGKIPLQPDKPTLLHNLDKFKLPANAIVVICEDVKEGMRLVPKGFLLSPEKYKALLDRIAELERKLKPDAPASPSTCRLRATGSLDGDSVRLEAEFKFKSHDKWARIALGCQGANPKKAELDGKEALLKNGDDGYVIQVEKGEGDKGEHVLTLEMNLPIVPRGGGLLAEENDRGFELTLPRAALTTLELERLPTGVKEVHCNKEVIRKAGEGVGLGPEKQVAVTWKKIAALPGTGPLLTARGKITVHVQEKLILTEAELTLHDERGQTKDWILGAPAQATVEVLPSDEPSGLASTISVNTKKQEHTIHFKEAPSEPVRVLIRVQRPFAPGRIPIGPFPLLNGGRQPGALLRRQLGTILIAQPPAGIFLSYHKPPPALIHVSQNEEITDKQKRPPIVAAFDYRAAPAPAQPGKGVSAGPPLLELEVRRVQGVVETTVKHSLRLEKAEQGWQVQAVTTIDAEPRRASIRALEVQLPRAWPEPLALLACWRGPQPGLPVNLVLAGAGSITSQVKGMPWPVIGRYQLDRNASLTDRVENIMPADANGRVQITLTEKKEKKFTLVLKGLYTLPQGDQRAVLELPRLLNTLDRGSEVEIVVPPEQELLPAEGGRERLELAGHKLTARPALSRVEFAWRPYRPDLPVTVTTDVTFRHGQAHVAQLVQFPAGHKLPRQVLFRLLKPLPGLGQTLRLTGGKLDPDSGGAGETFWPVALALDKSRSLKLEYHFPVTRPSLVQVPLLWLDQATRIDTKVRVWAEPDVMCLLRHGARWQELKWEVVPGRVPLPNLVLRGLERDMPLTLQLRDAALPTLATVLVERGLIQAVGMPGSGQTYRARFLVGKWNTSKLALELPAAASGLSVHLDGNRLAPRQPRNDKVEGEATAGTTYRLDIEPDNYTRPVILDVVYQIKPGEEEGEGLLQPGFLDTWRTVLHPPVLRGAVYLGRVRWQVQLPSGQVVLNPGNEAIIEQEWGLRGWLLAPQATPTISDLEDWLAGRRGQETGANGVSENTIPSLVCWQASPRPLHLVHVPQKTWLLVWSLLCLAVGLGLSFVPLARGPFRLLCWSAAALAGLAALITALLWPNLMPAILYGCEPGVAIVVLVLVIQWMLQHRYRRQLVFMPGFTRLKPGSSLVRAGSSNRPREPSTVDVPPVPENATAPRIS